MVDDDGSCGAAAVTRSVSLWPTHVTISALSKRSWRVMSL